MSYRVHKITNGIDEGICNDNGIGDTIDDKAIGSNDKGIGIGIIKADNRGFFGDRIAISPSIAYWK